METTKTTNKKNAKPGGKKACKGNCRKCVLTRQPNPLSKSCSMACKKSTIADELLSEILRRMV